MAVISLAFSSTNLAFQDDASVDHPGGDAMKHTFERLLIIRPPKQFAVDGNNIESIASEIQARHLDQELFLERVVANHAKDSVNSRGMERHS